MDPAAVSVHLIDDDSEALLGLYELFARGGYSVAASSRSIDALEVIRRSRPRVVVCDWEMKDMNGLEVLDRVRRLSPRTRVILLAEPGSWLQHDEVLRRGGDDLLFKPVLGSAVLRAVERVLDRDLQEKAPLIREDLS